MAPLDFHLNSNQKTSLDAFFNPKSIAVLGASRQSGKIGHEILRNLKLSGFEGEILPINPNAQSILGIKAHDSITSLGREIDLAIIALPAQMVEQVLGECARAGSKAVIIITSGFAEIGHSDLEERLLHIAKKNRMRIIGPNTFGIFYAKSKMNCTFGPHHVLSGKTAFITQSGALGLALMSWTTEEKYGVSAIVSIGNKSDVDDADLLDYFAQDDSTKSILIYMEGLKRGREFYKAAKRTVPRKPVVVIKAGRSERGAAAASSHTGSIAGTDRVFDAAFEESGVMRADTMTQAFDWIQAINGNPIPMGENVVIVTNGGGIGVLSADKCENFGLKLMEISDDLRDRLKKAAPSFGSLRNPIDLTANANDESYKSALEALLADENVHAIIALFCETANIDPSLVADAITSSEVMESRKKPITTAFIGGRLSNVAYKSLLEKGFAAYPTPERAVDGMYALIARYRETQGSRKGGGR